MLINPSRKFTLVSNCTYYPGAKPGKKHALNNQYAPNSELRLLTHVYGIRSIEIVPEQNRMLLYLCRAVAAVLVSPVSTVPLFPSLVAYLVLPIIAPLLGGHPRNAPKHIGTMLKLAK